MNKNRTTGMEKWNRLTMTRGESGGDNGEKKGKRLFNGHV